MRKINSFTELENAIKTNEAVWLLLMKSGSEQSECASKNFADAVEKITNHVFLVADVNETKDIHSEYGITTVPSLIEFKNAKLLNVIKGCHQPEQFRAILENAIFVASGLEESKIVKNVIVYSTPTCSWCTTLKRHLDAHQVKYREIDVSKDQKAAETMVRKSGQQGVPQTEINGQIVVGFDKNRLNRLLEIN
jgi:glutaredoxin-like YruB-family protein